MGKNVGRIFEKTMNLICLELDQRNMGMSMRVERSNVDQVRKRIEMNKAKQTEVTKEYNFEERMKELKEEVCPRKKFLQISLEFSLHRKKN